MLIVTGFYEAVEVLNNPKDFPSAIAPGGPAAHLPFTSQGGDITGQIEPDRDQIIAGDLLVALDDSRHANARAVLNRLLVPSRFKANEIYINELAHSMAREVVSRGSCEVIRDIAVPSVTLAIADLLGVPPEDRDQFIKVIEDAPSLGNIDAKGATTDVGPLEFMAGFFVRHLMERRAAPSGDVLSDLATATYPDGTVPDIIDLFKLSTFLFGAAHDTCAKLLGNSLLYLTRMPEVHRQLREDSSQIPPFIEEVLRLEGSSKVTFRLARRNTKIGSRPEPAGIKVITALAAANRDPCRDKPDAFQMNRPKLREQLAFGRGDTSAPARRLREWRSASSSRNSSNKRAISRSRRPGMAKRPIPSWVTRRALSSAVSKTCTSS